MKIKLLEDFAEWDEGDLNNSVEGVLGKLSKIENLSR